VRLVGLVHACKTFWLHIYIYIYIYNIYILHDRIFQHEVLKL